METFHSLSLPILPKQATDKTLAYPVGTRGSGANDTNPMDRPNNEPAQDQLETLAESEEAVTLEELDLPEDLKAELLRELEGFKGSDDEKRRGERPPGRA